MIIFHLIADEDSNLVLEVGIDRTLRLTYKGGDVVEGLRILHGCDGKPTQRIGIPLQRLDNMAKSKDTLRVILEQLFAGNPCQAKIHFGGLFMMYLSSRYEYVHFRQFSILLNENKAQPTELGIVMSVVEFAYFVSLLGRFASEIFEGKIITPCYKLAGHSLTCPECYPVLKPRLKKLDAEGGGGLRFLSYPISFPRRQ